MNSQFPQGREHDLPLAIIGISCIFPEADGLEAYWHNIRNGVDAITDVPDTHWSPNDFLNADPKAPDMTYASRGGFLPAVDFNPMDFGIAPHALEATDTAQLLGLYTARRALIDAGYGLDREFDRDRVSVILGVTGTLELTISLGARLGHPFWRRALAEAGVNGEVAEDVVRRIADSYVEWQEASFPGLLGNVVAGRIANRLDLGGTNCVVDAACASSLGALSSAFRPGRIALNTTTCSARATPITKTSGCRRVRQPTNWRTGSSLWRSERFVLSRPTARGILPSSGSPNKQHYPHIVSPLHRSASV